MRTLRVEDCVSQAEASKEVGNSLLRAGDISEALAKYADGLQLLHLFREKTVDRAFGEELRQRADAMYIALHLNCAQACLKMRDWVGAADHADKVLVVDPDNLKALYRRAVAQSQSERGAPQACADFARVLELDPHNSQAQEQLEQVRQRLRSFYDLLSAHPGASTSQLRQAYLREAKRWHPDKAAKEDKALATQRFKDIAEAHEVLRDPQLRHLYDLYLQHRFRGHIAVEDPEDPRGGCVNVSFQDWAEFRRIFEGALPSAGAKHEADEHDPDDAPLSWWEWLAAGSVVLAVMVVSARRWSHQQWLKCLPLDIYYVHEEYSVPMALLMSPFFFGNAPWDDTVRWLRAMVEQVALA